MTQSARAWYQPLPRTRCLQAIPLGTSTDGAAPSPALAASRGRRIPISKPMAMATRATAEVVISVTIPTHSGATPSSSPSNWPAFWPARTLHRHRHRRCHRLRLPARNNNGSAPGDYDNVCVRGGLQGYLQSTRNVSW